MIQERDLDAVIERIHPKYRPIWEGRTREEQIALARYYLPANSNAEWLVPTRPKVAKLYCPFACQTYFPSGHRLCINSYAGCDHDCIYCYAAGYSPLRAKEKKDFVKGLLRDMASLQEFAVPSAPVHISNSTDPFQPLEEEVGATRFALEQILQHRRQFDMVTLLTKNPLAAAKEGYIQLLQDLCELPHGHGKKSLFGDQPALCVQVSLAFWRDEVARFYDPGAPSVADRLDGMAALRDAGIPVVLRVDPLFPRNPLPLKPDQLSDYGLVEPQTLEDLDHLLQFAEDHGIHKVVYSAAKITLTKGGLCEAMQCWRNVYTRLAAPAKLPWQGGSWRLPREVLDQYVTAPFLALCRRRHIVAQFCMQDLLHSHEQRYPPGYVPVPLQTP